MIINAANSTVGQALLQLARLLRLRTVALLRDHEQRPGYFEKASARLSALGATHVMRDDGPIKVRAVHVSACGHVPAFKSECTRQALELCTLEAVPSMPFGILFD